MHDTVYACLKPELVKTVKDLYLAWQARLEVKIPVIWKNP